MFEGLVSSLLKTYIGKYVNVNQDKLSIGLLSGVVELENASLRLDAINDDNRFPFFIKFGHIGKIKLNISWNALRQSPWSLIAENINIIIGPKRECKKKKAAETDVSSQKAESTISNEEQNVLDETPSLETIVTSESPVDENKSGLLVDYENKWFKEVEMLGIYSDNPDKTMLDDDTYGNQKRLHVFSYLASFAYSLLNNLHVSLKDLHIR